MEEGFDPLGGFLVPDVYLRELLKIPHPEGVFASRCRQINVPGQLVKLPAFDESTRAVGERRGGMRGYHLAEAEQYTKSAPRLRMIKLEPEKVGVMTPTPVTKSLRMAFTAVGPILLQLAVEELSFMQDDEIVNGTGAAMPMGVFEQ